MGDLRDVFLISSGVKQCQGVGLKGQYSIYASLGLRKGLNR